VTKGGGTGLNTWKCPRQPKKLFKKKKIPPGFDWEKENSVKHCPVRPLRGGEGGPVFGTLGVKIIGHQKRQHEKKGKKLVATRSIPPTPGNAIS